MKQMMCILLCLVLQVGWGQDDPQFATQVNLALRQVGHQLLLLEGDKKSTIPPVQVNDAGGYTLKIASVFKYDTLPQLIDAAFESFNVERPYRVVVTQCSSDSIILGYHMASYKSGMVACLGREQWSDCNNILVSFTAPIAPTKPDAVFQSFPLPLWLLGSVALVGIGFFWRHKLSKSTELPPPASPETPLPSTIPIGSFHFDPQNQTLLLGEQEQSLTFRENKLLHVMAQRINQVVKRETLVAEVWEDEGVMVSRSLDVFVSRLRKLLKGDEQVAIKNIHGVGYRLEVKKEA